MAPSAEFTFRASKETPKSGPKTRKNPNSSQRHQQKERLQCLEVEMLKSSSDDLRKSQENKSAFAAFSTMEHHQAAVAAAAAAWDQVRLGGQYPPVSMQSG